MLDRFNKRLNKTFKSYTKNEKIMDFKEELLGSLMDRYNELKSEGLSDEESYNKSLEILDGINDTIETLVKDTVVISENNPYQKYLLPFAAYWLFVVICYLGYSFISGNWNKSWLIFVGGAVLFTLISSIAFYKVSKEKGLKSLSRINILSVFICLSATVYLIWSFVSQDWSFTWITFVIGLLIWYISDILLRKKQNKGKFKVSVFDAIIITVLASLIIYIIISFTFSVWASSWLIFVVMMLVIVLELMIFAKK